MSGRDRRVKQGMRRRVDEKPKIVWCCFEEDFEVDGVASHTEERHGNANSSASLEIMRSWKRVGVDVFGCRGIGENKSPG